IFTSVTFDPGRTARPNNAALRCRSGQSSERLVFQELGNKMAAKPDPDTTLLLTRDYTSDRQRVFDAFLDADALQWIWSTDAYQIVEMSVDARVGGGWRLAMRDEATGAVGHCTARYIEIDRPSRIVWLTKWLDGPLADAPEARVTLEFSTLKDGTRLKLTHEFFPNRQTRDQHGMGWGAGLEKLAHLLGAGK